MKKYLFLFFVLLILSTACTPIIKPDNISLYANLDYQAVIKKINTPEEAAWYLKNYLHYQNDNVRRSFKYVHKRGYGICAEYAFSAAALLSDNNYPPLILHVLLGKSPDNIQLTHALYVYQDSLTKKWGSLGQKRENILPRFKTLEEMCLYFNDQDFYSQKIVAYKLHNIFRFNFIDGEDKEIYKFWNSGKKIILANTEKNPNN